MPAESSSTTLEDVTNTPRHSEDGAGGSRVSQGLTKQWVRLRQQLAEARQTIMAKESLVSKLHGQLQQGEPFSEPWVQEIGDGEIACLRVPSLWHLLSRSPCPAVQLSVARQFFGIHRGT